MLKGIDVSSFQDDMSFGPYDFVIIKASEGYNWIDPGLNRHFNNLAGNTSGKPLDNKLYGFYHYARPDLGNTPEEEAEWFISLVGHHKYHAIFALDWEQKSLNYSPEWALRWLRKVEDLTGVKPLIYLQGSEAMLGKYKDIADEGFGLWVAHWGVDTPAFGNWSFYAIHQYQGAPLDKNYFNGTREMFKKYAGCKEPVKPSEPLTPELNELNELKVGDTVKVTSVMDYNRTINDSWVLRADFEVLEAYGDRIVIGMGTAVTGVWRRKDIVKL